MLENRVPFDVAFELHGTPQMHGTHELAELFEQVRAAAAMSQESLDREFVKRMNDPFLSPRRSPDRPRSTPSG